MSKKITVVIPAYNEAELLPSCFRALLPQAQAFDAEVLVIDNNSTDQTAELARQAGVRVIHETQQGVVFALQRGLREAQGEIVAFTDADTTVCPTWIATILSTFEHEPGTVAITGPVRFQRMRLLSSLRWFYRHLLMGSNMAVRRTDGLAIGGFDQRYNLASDIAFGWALQQRGVVHAVNAMSVTTSSRRFQAQPFRQAIKFFLNHLWMLLFHQPLFWHFTPIRKSQIELERQAQRRTWVIGTALFVLATVYLSVWPNSTVFGQISVHGHPQERDIALTFDDGPNGAATRAIVDTLVAKNVPATFFEVGRSIAADPETTKYVADHGFVIANHSWDHSFKLPYRRPQEIREELQKTNELITATTGKTPTYFRPPHGFRSPQLLYEADRLSLRVVDWSVDPQDYLTGDTERIVGRVLTQTRKGRIILMHDGLQDGPRTKPLHDRQGTIRALPVIIDSLRQRGYTFVSLDQLLGPAPVETDDRPAGSTSG